MDYYYDPPPPCSGSPPRPAVLHTPHPQHPFSTRFHPYSHSFPGSYSPSWHPPLLPKQPSSRDFSHYESLQPQPLPPMPPSLNSVHVAKTPKYLPFSAVEFVPRPLLQQTAATAALAMKTTKDNGLEKDQKRLTDTGHQVTAQAVPGGPSTEAHVPELTADMISAVGLSMESTTAATSPMASVQPSMQHTMGTIDPPMSPPPLPPPIPNTSIISQKTRQDLRTTPSVSSTTMPQISFAIWSRRPGDPSKAPGVIISTRAKPPSEVVQKALDSRTPPFSPIHLHPLLAAEGLNKTEKPGRVDARSATGPDEALSLKADVPAVQVAFKHQHRVQQARVRARDPTIMMMNDDVISSSENVTEVTEATEGVLTRPGSPISTSTSLSVSIDPGAKNKEAAHAEGVNSLARMATADVEKPPAAIPSSVMPGTTTSTPAATGPSSSTNTTLVTNDAAAVIASRASAPSKPTAPKLWSSLFAPSSSPSASTSGSNGQRGALPISSVMGISIPASTSIPTISVAPAKKNELLSLLTNGPGAMTSRAGGQKQLEKINTRGLINSGNMCFANAVLQVLVYCSPFQRLFIELGKLLVSYNIASPSSPSSLNVAGSSTMVNGVSAIQLNGNSTSIDKQQKSQTPFIDATVEFLKEFIDDGDGGQRRDGLLGFRETTGGGKGKEREIFSAGDFSEDGEGQKDESFLPWYVYDAMKEKKRFESMRGGQQEDAEEFLGFYLDTLEEELLHIQNSLTPLPSSSKSARHLAEEKEEPEIPEDGWLEVGKKNRTIVARTIKAVESPITRIFGGKFKSTLKAPEQKDSVLVEDWRSLRLDIQRDTIHTIQEALVHITHPQHIQMAHSSRPDVTIDASQRVLIDALPPILVLHVKRFCYDTNVGGVVKVMKQVWFGPELEIGRDMMAPSGKRSQPTKYRLFAVIYHHGYSASGGHYTLDVLHPNRYPGTKVREGWVRIDDELVSDVRTEDVFDAWEKEKDEMRNAYLLFYRRVRNV